MPPFRTLDYYEWKACERLGIFPAGVKPNWDDNDSWTKQKILAYDEVREHEEIDLKITLAGGKNKGADG